jgi:hypothetical protein
MPKILILSMLIGLATTPGTFASGKKNPPKKSEPAETATPSGTTTEVRYTSSPSSQKGPRLTKVVITRDSSGRIISVKRH